MAYPNAIDVDVHPFTTHEERRVARHPNKFEFGDPVEIEWDTLLNQVRAGDYADAAVTRGQASCVTACQQLAVLLAAARMPVET